MTVILFEFITLLCASALVIVSSTVSVQAQSAALRQAKSSAEAKGYVFETNHDEIVAKAKKERQFESRGTNEQRPQEEISFSRSYGGRTRLGGIGPALPAGTEGGER